MKMKWCSSCLELWIAATIVSLWYSYVLVTASVRSTMFKRADHPVPGVPLEDGGYFGAQRDKSDPQWPSVAESLPKLFLLAIIYVVGSRSIRVIHHEMFKSRKIEEQTKESRWGMNSLLVWQLSYYVGFSLVVFLPLFGSGIFFYVMFCFLNYYIGKHFGASRWNPILTWVLNLAVLFGGDILGGYRFGSLWSGLKILDEFEGILNWEVYYNVAMCRNISYNVDLYRRLRATIRDGRQSVRTRTAIEKNVGLWEKSRSISSASLSKYKVIEKEVRATVLDEIDRFKDENVDLSAYRLLSFAAYVFYLPLCLGGPMVAFEEWIAQVVYNSRPENELGWSFFSRCCKGKEITTASVSLETYPPAVRYLLSPDDQGDPSKNLFRPKVNPFLSYSSRPIAPYTFRTLAFSGILLACFFVLLNGSLDISCYRSVFLAKGFSYPHYNEQYDSNVQVWSDRFDEYLKLRDNSWGTPVTLPSDQQTILAYILTQKVRWWERLLPRKTWSVYNYPKLRMIRFPEDDLIEEGKFDFPNFFERREQEIQFFLNQTDEPGPLQLPDRFSQKFNYSMPAPKFVIWDESVEELKGGTCNQDSEFNFVNPFCELTFENLELFFTMRKLGFPGFVEPYSRESANVFSEELEDFEDGSEEQVEGEEEEANKIVALLPITTRAPSFDYVVASFYQLFGMYLKFLVIWRFFRIWAIFDGIDVIENMNRCLAQSTSFKRFWKMWHRSLNRWILSYVYRPMGGGDYAVFNIWFVFLFIGMWHDRIVPWLCWALLNCIAFSVEIIVGNFVRSTKWGAKLLDGHYRRYAEGCGGTLTISLLVMANVSIDLGFKTIWRYFSIVFFNEDTFVVFFLSSVLCFAQVLVVAERRERERGRGEVRDF